MRYPITDVSKRGIARVKENADYVDIYIVTDVADGVHGKTYKLWDGLSYTREIPEARIQLAPDEEAEYFYINGNTLPWLMRRCGLDV